MTLIQIFIDVSREKLFAFTVLSHVFLCIAPKAFRLRDWVPLCSVECHYFGGQKSCLTDWPPNLYKLNVLCSPAFHKN